MGEIRVNKERTGGINWVALPGLNLPAACIERPTPVHLGR